jgi:hypothetical protein
MTVVGTLGFVRVSGVHQKGCGLRVGLAKRRRSPRSARQLLLDPAAEDILLEYLPQEYLHHVGDYRDKQRKDDQPAKRGDVLFRGSPMTRAGDMPITNKQK